MDNRISITVENGVADVRLIRSDKMNALDNAMFEALIEAGDVVSKDKSVRCVVMSGEGRAFCAGLDMGNFGKMSEGDSGVTKDREPLATRSHGIANRAQQAVWAWRQCPVPVIAAVHGVAFGGGFQVMLGSDIRLVHPETKLSIMEIKWGLIPDMAGTALMRELARGDIIRELTYTGRVFSGTEAAEYGFATRTSDDPHAEAMALAKEIASKSPSAIQAAKEIFNSVAVMSDADALMQESVVQDRVMGRANQIEAVMAGLQKRDGAFEDVR
jgi:enoyl-CoA hydratase/carnithine racemase